MADATRPKDIMGTLEYYLVTKAPYQLPAGVKEWIVKYSPWIDVLVLVLLAPAVLFALGIGTIVLPFSGLAGAHAAAGLSLALLALLVQVGLMIAALPGLFARKRVGWNFAFYGVVFNLVYSLMNFNIIGGLVNALISSYFLFQIRSYYS